MSVSVIQINKSLPNGARLYSGIQQIATGLALLNDEFAVMGLMHDTGTGLFTQTAVDRYGCADIAGVTAAFDQVNSLLSKLNTNADVTAVNDAIMQTFHKFG